MKNLLFFILLGITQFAIAGTNLQNPIKIMVDFSFNYNIKNSSGFNDNSHIQNKLTIETNNQWIVLGGLQSQSSIQPPLQSPHPRSNQLLLLCKIEKADAKKTTLTFLIIDQNEKSSSVFEPKMTIRYGKKGELKIHNNNQDIQISVLANKN